MKEIPFESRQELLDELLIEHTPELAKLIVAINDVLYQYHLDGGLPYLETDIEAQAIANELIEAHSADIHDIESIIIKVYQQWFGKNCLSEGIPEPALLTARSAYQQYVKKSSETYSYQTPYIYNENTIVLFFHGLDSNHETSKFTCISREPKYCQTVDYRNNFKQVFEIYDNLIQTNLNKYDHVVLVGHSLGAWFANHFAHKYGLRALLIAPCINPNETVVDRIPAIQTMSLSFPKTNPEKTYVMVEIEDECLDVATARHELVELPESWQVDYYENGNHRIAREYEIWERLNDLCDDPIVFVDEAEFLGED